MLKVCRNLIAALALALTALPAQAQVVIGGSAGSSATSIGVTTVAASGASQALAFAAKGDVAYDVTLTANCTITISGGTAGQLQGVTLILRQDGTAGRIPTLPAGIKWKGGIAPTPNTQAGKIDVFYIYTPDGGTTLLGDF